MAAIGSTTEPPVNADPCDDRCRFARWLEHGRHLEVGIDPPADFMRLACPLHSRYVARRMSLRELYFGWERQTGIPAHHSSEETDGRRYHPFAAPATPISKVMRRRSRDPLIL
jgi:hypothetical protein